jgi:uncharacterized protein (TIGR03435 family)
MLRDQLADRFKLVVRRELRNQRAYSLVFAQAKGSFGPALNQAPDPECVNTQRGGGPGPNDESGCGQVQFGPGRLAGTSVT